MKGFFDQRKIIVVLFITAVIFLLANIAADKVTGEDSSNKKVEADVNIIEQNFISSLRNLGIDTAWIVPKKNKKTNSSLSYPQYKVNLPVDLPVALVIKEVTNTFNAFNVNLNVIEKSISGRTLLSITSGKNTILKSEFNYVSGLKRKAGSVGFMVEDFSDLDEQEDSLLLNSPEALAVILVPSKSAVELSKRIDKAGKEYVVELNDDISELKYKLNTSYTMPRLKNSLRSILADFDKAIFIMIDDNSGIYNSPVYTMLKSELGKRNIRLIKKNVFRELEEEMLKQYLHNFNDGEKKAAIIDAEEYLKIGSTVAGFRKIGYKFINPSLAVDLGEKKY